MSTERHTLGRWLRSAASLIASGFAVLLLLLAPHSARADSPVDLQLILAVDASGSINEVRFELQKQGYVAAFRNPRVVNAIRGSASQAIAVTMIQWTGPSLQYQVIPWTLVKDAASAHLLAAAIGAAPRQLFSGGTSISGAIDYSLLLFPRSPFEGGRRVIDISGDGANNRGRPAHEARDDAVAQGVIINGLPILSLEPFLDRYYQSDVIGGPNAFMVVAHSYEEFADAILKKLITEIAGHATPPPFAALSKGSRQ